MSPTRMANVHALAHAGMRLVSFAFVVLIRVSHMPSEGLARVDAGDKGNHEVGVNRTGPYSYRSPSLLAVQGSLITVSETWDTTDEKKYVDVITEYSRDYGTSLVTQVAIRSDKADFHAVYTHQEDRESTLHPTAVASGDKVYVLVFCKNIGANDSLTGDQVIMPYVATGTVLPLGAIGETWVDWTALNPIRALLPGFVGGKRASRFFGGGGNGIATPQGTIIIPVQVVRTDDEYFASIIYSTNGGSSWALAKGVTDAGCRESSVLEWKGKLLLVSRSNDGFTKVYESGDMGTKWTEALGTISRVFGNSPNRTGPGNQGSAVVANIDNVPVMIFSHTTVLHGGGDGDDSGRIREIHQRIWLSDGNRIVKVGHIYWDDHLQSSHNNLLYDKGKLFCAYEAGAEKTSAVLVRSLDDELSKVEAALEAWKRQDSYLSTVCASGSDTAPCESGVPIDGLVGLLSTTLSERQWIDAYLSVSAEVVGARSIPQGVLFEGPIRGGRWPVAAQGQNQRYHFVSKHFTLVITVSIHERTTDRAPLLVLRPQEDAGADLELSYTADHRWHVRHGNEHGSTSGAWVKDREHQLVLVCEAGDASLYLDGKRMPTMGRRLVESGAPLGVSHFSIGGYGLEKRSPNGKLTVRNVMLYNRPLNKTEIDTVFHVRDKITAATTIVKAFEQKNRVNVQMVNSKQDHPTAPNNEEACGALSTSLAALLLLALLTLT
uniref:Putative trans-sialidase n=1 Tax=Trypanosoma congolense (strain IL3000) TaxID=1068625 RepID=G0UJK9_TRYCI|nr:putative trans-sialidase [Trypanosoma congolense IL3000]